MRACFNANKNPQARPEAQSRRHGLRAFLSAKSPGPGRKGGADPPPKKAAPFCFGAQEDPRRRRRRSKAGRGQTQRDWIRPTPPSRRAWAQIPRAARVDAIGLPLGGDMRAQAIAEKARGLACGLGLDPRARGSFGLVAQNGIPSLDCRRAQRKRCGGGGGGEEKKQGKRGKGRSGDGRRKDRLSSNRGKREKRPSRFSLSLLTPYAAGEGKTRRHWSAKARSIR